MFNVVEGRYHTTVGKIICAFICLEKTFPVFKIQPVGLNFSWALSTFVT